MKYKYLVRCWNGCGHIGSTSLTKYMSPNRKDADIISDEEKREMALVAIVWATEHKKTTGHYVEIEVNND